MRRISSCIAAHTPLVRRDRTVKKSDKANPFFCENFGFYSCPLASPPFHPIRRRRTPRPGALINQYSFITNDGLSLSDAQSVIHKIIKVGSLCAAFSARMCHRGRAQFNL